MQPRSSDRVWEPPAARAPVSAALSRVRPIVVIDVSKKTVLRNGGTDPIQRHGPRVSDASLLVALLSASPHVFAAVGSRIGGNAMLLIPRRTQGWRDAHLTTNCGARLIVPAC